METSPDRASAAVLTPPRVVRVAVGPRAGENDMGDDHRDRDSPPPRRRANESRTPGDSGAGHADDGFLAARAKAGDRAAFDRLVERYQRPAVSISFRLLGNLADAQEVTQDAFLKAYTGLAELHHPEAFGGWLLRIVSNLSLNRRRGRVVREAADLDDVMDANGGDEGADDNGGSGPEDRHDPAREMIGRELGDRVRLALDRLPEKQRTALMLFTLEDRPQKEIADVLGCTVEAVKWHVFQGRKKLKEWLKDDL